MRQKSNGFLLLGLLLGVLCLSGCEDDPMFTAQYQRPAVQIKVPQRLSVQKPAITFIYSPIGKRDPFRSHWLDVATTVPRPSVDSVVEEQRPRTELEKYELDQLKLVAMVTGSATPMAMVEDPSGRGYQVQVGTLIGKHRGRVIRIRRDVVVISQVYRNHIGERIVNLYPLRMQKTGQKLDGTVKIDGRRIVVDEQGQVRYQETLSESEQNRKAKVR